MQEIATVSKGAASLHSHVPSHLLHPLLVRVDGDPGDFHLAALEMDKEQHVVGHQSAQREDLLPEWQPTGRSTHQGGRLLLVVLSLVRSHERLIGVAMADGTIAGSAPLLSWRVPAEMNAGAIVMGSLASKEDHPGELKSFASLREEMVERNIAARGVRDELVLSAMRKVPRELFLPKNLREFAHEDLPLPIAGGQTISQPYIVAFMAESLQLKGGEKILEIGAGSGYAAAVLSEIAAKVYTVERLGQLADT